MKLPTKDELKPLGYAAAILIISAIMGIIFTDTSSSGMFSLAFAIFFYLMVPGYFVMLNFNFDALERIVLGMVVSAAVIPAYLYAINIFGLEITKIAVIGAIVLVTGLSILYRKESAHKVEKKKTE